VADRTDPAAGPAGGPADTAGPRAGRLADTVADSVGDRAAAVGSVTAVVGMAGRPEVSAGSEIPTAARAGALGIPVPRRGQAARRGDSIPANRRARALAELSPAKLCLIKLNAFAADVLPGDLAVWDDQVAMIARITGSCRLLVGCVVNRGVGWLVSAPGAHCRLSATSLPDPPEPTTMDKDAHDADREERRAQLERRRAAVARQLRRLATELADLDRRLDEIERSER